MVVVRAAENPIYELRGNGFVAYNIPELVDFLDEKN